MSEQRLVTPTNLLASGYFHPALRAIQQDLKLGADNLMYPVFVTDQPQDFEPIASMPGQNRMGVERVVDYLAPLVSIGLKSIILFPVLKSGTKDERGDVALSHDANPLFAVLPVLREAFPQLFIACDVCLCGYTSHGHCGHLKHDGTISLASTLAHLADLSVQLAKAGAQCIAPSDMMCGRIGAIKHRLLAAGLTHVTVMSYSAKFASAMYGPFRDAAGSAPSAGDRKSYQLPPGARGLALRAIDRDVAEGADIIMVKPGTPYLDIVRAARDRVNVPVAVYHVSGEYAQLHHAAAAGGLDLEAATLEVLLCMRRAGADLLITYSTPLVLKMLDAQNNATPAQ